MEESYYNTQASVEEYIQMAKDVNSQNLIDQFKAFLTPNSQLLEIGSGPGTDWKILHETHHTIGSDNSNIFIDHLTNKNPSGEFLLLDAVSLKTNNRFDGIYANKVMHHLTNEEILTSVKRQSDILNTNGILCHSFWKGKGSETFKGLFVNYHSPNSIKTIYDPFFEILLLEPYQEFEKDDSIVLIAKKKQL